jgi:hypothetical protein
MKYEDYIKTSNGGCVWWKHVNRTIDERPEIYLGLLPERSYSLIDVKENKTTNCNHKNAYSFHDNAPMFCPDCGKYFDILTIN